MAPEPFFKWLQRQHGIGALLLPLAALIVLALSLWLNREPTANDEPTPFQDYPLDTGSSPIASLPEADLAPAPSASEEIPPAPTEARRPHPEPPAKGQPIPPPPVTDLGTPMTGEVPAAPGAE